MKAATSALAVYLCLLAGIAAGNPIVAAHQRFHRDTAYQTLHAGKLLIEELNCVACHASERVSESKQAPVLTGVMSRAKAEHLRDYILDPQKVKPGTTMPGLLARAEDAPSKADAIVHYLGSLGTSQPTQGYANPGGKRRGEQLFHSVGCVACHNPADKELATSVPLGDLPAKYTLLSLATFLHNPLQARPAGRMPSMNLTSREAADIAAYLLPATPEKAGIEYAYYELEDADRLPDFEQLEPKAVGTATKFDIQKHAIRQDQFALRYRGTLQTQVEGTYRFSLASDDGSKLYMDGNLLIDNDGTHGMQQKQARVKLSPGSHTVVLEYFERDGGEELEVTFAPPGGDRGRLDVELVSATPQEPLEDIQFIVDASKVAVGKRLFSSLGCAACHQVDMPIQTSFKGPALAKLDATKGCLTSSHPPANYDLDDSQRTAIRNYLGVSAETRAAWSDAQKIQHTTLQFNCVACHQRGDRGGVEEQRNAYFQTTQQEMGVEGSIPPHLNAIGAKLTRAWLEQILAEGAKDRPYMLTKMPKFGTANIGTLAGLLIESDKVSPLPDVPVDESAKKIGHRLVGDKGFSCIKCHTFGRHKATGVQSIDMTIMTKRLQKDWFRRYVRNPQAYRTGTRMPSAWPIEGESYLPDLLDGDSDKQIAAVWKYLEAGTAAITPSGLATGSKELIPIDEAIIYRNFIQGAGPRAIAVGSPEGLHFAFDANELCLAMIWKGAFMNAARHWSGRGQGFEPPAGQSVQPLVQGLPIASLESAQASWPDSSALELDDYRFLGYQLVGEFRYPAFKYQAGALRIIDFTTPQLTPTSTTLLRKLTVSGKPPEQTYFRVAVGKVTEDIADARRFDVGDGWKIVVRKAAAPALLRRSGDVDELLIPLGPDGTQDIELEYIW